MLNSVGGYQISGGTGPIIAYDSSSLQIHGGVGLRPQGAVWYRLHFSLLYLSTHHLNYHYLASTYNYVKLRKVKCVFTPPIQPSAGPIAPAMVGFGNYDFANWPHALDSHTWVERDGFTYPPAIGATGNPWTVSGGDVTPLTLSKLGCRTHKAFSVIRRTFIPRVIDLVASNAPTPTTPATLIAGPRSGFTTKPDAGYFGGELCIAFPYIGPVNSTQLQPVCPYAVSTAWYLEFRSTLAG